MCWKQEWAKAINNLSRAITYVERAKAKIHKRLVRNKANLKRLSQDKKFNYPSMLEPVQTLIAKNQAAEAECEQIIASFKEKQAKLYHMITVYGIKRSEKSQKMRQLMAKYLEKEVEA